MKVEKYANSRLELWLTPDDELEALFLRLMAEKAAKGQKATIRQEDGRAVFSVEN